MGKKYFITTTDECPGCNGTGLTKNWNWKQYWNENPKGLSGEEFDAWWRQYVKTSIYGFPLIPDEEEYCYECEGTGIVRREIELKDVLKEIGLL